MLTIKLSRLGKKKQPTFRLLVLEKTKDQWGNYLENLGHYNPRTKKAELKAERIKHWLTKGAQLTDSVHNLLNSQGIVSGKKKKISKISKRRGEKLGLNKREAAAPTENKTETKS